MGDGWVLLVYETLVNRVPPTSCRPPRCPRLPPATKSLVPARGLGLGAGLSALPAQELLGNRIHAWGRGGETDDFIFFKGDSQFVHPLITRASELEFHG